MSILIYSGPAILISALAGSDDQSNREKPEVFLDYTVEGNRELITLEKENHASLFTNTRMHPFYAELFTRLLKEKSSET